MSAVLAVWRRELAGYFHAPIAYVVGVLFLAIQGLSFWALVETLSDPIEPAPMGAVLSGYFGGNLLYWSVLFVVVATLAMRLVAEERRTGTWELLLTTAVDPRSILVGKWLGAVCFYILLWVPTLLYLVVLTVYAPPGMSFDPGPVLSAYLGVFLAGCGFLGVGIAASAGTRNQIVASVATFAILFALLLVGQLGELAPGWLASSPRLAATVAWIDVRDHMGRFAGGSIDSGPVVFYLGLAAIGLAVAAALVAVGRRRRAEVQARFLAATLVVVIVVLGNIIAAAHPSHWDVTESGSNSLDAVTRGVVDRVETDVQVLVIAPGEPAFAALWAQVDAVVDRMVQRQPRLHRRDVDLTLEPDRAGRLAAEFAITPKDLKDYGAVVVQAGERRRIVDLIDLAGFEKTGRGAGRVARFRAEEAIATALAEISVLDRPVVCATSGHGELPPRGQDSSPSWTALAHRLEREGMVIEDVGVVSAGVPAYCRVLVVFGPAIALSQDETLAVARYLKAGGRLLLATLAAIDPAAQTPSLPATGLELVLEDFDLALPAAIASDPSPKVAVERLPGGFRVVDGYGDHAISAGYRGRRFTVWQLPRVVSVTGDRATALVSTSADGWGESELTSAGASTAADDKDLPGPVVIAAAATSGRARVVVFGSARSLSSELIERGLGSGDALAATAITWLGGREIELEIGDKTPEQLRLVMTPGERNTVFLLCVVIIPLIFAGAGGFAWRKRRRA